MTKRMNIPTEALDEIHDRQAEEFFNRLNDVTQYNIMHLYD